jgi:hypothetical protein
MSKKKRIISKRKAITLISVGVVLFLLVGVFSWLVYTGKIELGATTKASSVTIIYPSKPPYTTDAGRFTKMTVTNKTAARGKDSKDRLYAAPGDELEYKVGFKSNIDGLISPYVYDNINSSANTNLGKVVDVLEKDDGTMCDLINNVSYPAGAFTPGCHSCKEAAVDVGKLGLIANYYICDVVNPREIVPSVPGPNLHWLLASHPHTGECSLKKNKEITFKFKVKVKNDAQPGTIAKNGWAAGWWTKEDKWQSRIWSGDHRYKHLEIKIVKPPPEGIKYKITVKAKGDCYKGCPKMEIKADGKTVNRRTVDTSVKYTNYDFYYTTPSKPKYIDVKFYNDNGPRDLFVDSVVFDGKKIKRCDKGVVYYVMGGETVCGAKLPKRSYNWDGVMHWNNSTLRFPVK